MMIRVIRFADDQDLGQFRHPEICRRRQEQVFGDRKDQWAMTINGPWRLCFRFEDGDAWDVEIVDYH
jgi:plasmid maintenance system killer protein